MAFFLIHLSSMVVCITKWRSFLTNLGDVQQLISSPFSVSQDAGILSGWQDVDSSLVDGNEVRERRWEHKIRRRVLLDLPKLIRILPAPAAIGRYIFECHAWCTLPVHRMHFHKKPKQSDSSRHLPHKSQTKTSLPWVRPRIPPHAITINITGKIRYLSVKYPKTPVHLENIVEHLHKNLRDLSTIS